MPVSRARGLNWAANTIVCHMLVTDILTLLTSDFRHVFVVAFALLGCYVA